MTRAPTNLLAVRDLLLAHLDIAPGAVGIVGDSSHRGGYHCGSDRVVTNDYSVVESSRDRDGLTLDAAALDVGTFTAQAGGRTHTLRTFSAWCVAQCEAGSADTRDIREIIYSADGRTVRRWDRLRRRSTGDDSHLWHTHVSFFRDAIKAGRPQVPLFRRYLTETAILEDEMTAAEFLAILRDPTVAATMRALPWQYTGGGIPEGMSALGVLNEIVLTGRVINGRLGGDLVDEAAIIAGVLRGISPQAIADAIPASLAQDVVDELSARLSAA